MSESTGDTPQWVPTPGDRYQYDEGAPWCMDRASHPQFHGGYPLTEPPPDGMPVI
jgi:hypothetical protein